MNTARKNKTESLPGNTGPWIFFFSLFTIVVLLLLLANNIHQKSYSLLNRTWGFDHIEYYSPYFKVAFFAVLFVGIILFSNAKFYGACYTRISRISAHALISLSGKYKIWIFLFISVVAGLLLYSVRMKYIFLGDFDIRLNSTVEGDFHRDSYMTMLLLNKIYHFVNKSFGVSAREVFVLASVISGGLYTFITLLIADLLGGRKWQKTIIALFCLLNGSIFLFTGYVEIYPLPAVMVMLTLYLSILYIKDRARFIFVIPALLIAIGMHIMSVALLPGVIFAYIYKNYKKIRWLRISRTTVIILILLSFPVIYALAGHLHLVDLVPLKESSYYTLFSFTHLWELLNSQILASGLSFLLFLFVLYCFLRKRIRENPVVYFLLVQSFYLFCIVFMVNKMRGSTDSDITAFPSFAYNLLVVYLLANQLIERISRQAVFYILSFTLLFNSMNAAAWIGITSSDRSVDKIADMIGNDPAHYYVNRMPPDMLLAMIYAHNGLIEDAIRYYEKSYRSNYSDPRAHYNYGTFLLNHEKESAGIRVLANLTDQFPSYPMAYPVLISYYQTRSEYENLYKTALNMLKGYKMNPLSFKRLDKNFVVSVFSYLLNVAKSNNNVELMKEVTPVLADLDNS